MGPAFIFPIDLCSSKLAIASRGPRFGWWINCDDAREQVAPSRLSGLNAKRVFVAILAEQIRSYPEWQSARFSRMLVADVQTEYGRLAAFLSHVPFKPIVRYQRA